MKKILITIIIVLAVFLIYIGFKNQKIYYLNIGDEIALGKTPYGNNDYSYSDSIKDYLSDKSILKKYVLYAHDDQHTTDIIKDIKENNKINVDNTQKHFQNVLIKADLITLSIGTNDFLKNLDIDNDFTTNDLYNTFNESLEDFEDLFKLLRDYCKEKIVFIGFYDKTNNQKLNEFFKYVNSKMSELTLKYNIIYIDTYNLFYNSTFIDTYPTKQGYQLLANEIVKKIDFD